MRIKHSLLLLVWLAAIAAHAQTDTTRKADSFIGIGYGASLPVGFSAAPGTGFGHYATPGTCTYLQGGAVFKRLKLGFIIKEGWFRNGFSRDKYRNNLQAHDTVAGETYYANGGDVTYRGGYGMAGIIADIHIHKLALGVRLLGGRFTVIFPEVAYFVTFPNSSNYYDYDFAATATYALAAEAGVHANYPFAKHWCAVADAGFLYSRFVYSTTVQYTDSSGSSLSGAISYNCTYTIINTTLGIAYCF